MVTPLLAGLAALGVLIGLVAFPALGSATVSVQGGTISRSEVLQRAQYWIDNPPGTYSESDYGPDSNGDPYRRDCSGFVSMAWHLTSSLNTSTLPNISTQITKDQLQPGDIMDAAYGAGSYTTGHVAIFAGWTSSAHSAYFGYEFGADPPTYRQIPYPYDSSDPRTYLPYRYNNIVDDSAASPAGLQVTDTTTTSIALSWSTVSGATSYKILRGGTVISSQSSTAFTDTGLQPGSSYSYAVESVNQAGVVSAPSAAVSATTEESRPDAVLTSSGNQMVYYRSPSGGLNQALFSNGSWSSYGLTGANTMAGQPSAIATANGNQTVYYRTPSGALAQAVYDGTWHFFGLTAANSVSGQPSAVVTADGNQVVYYRTPSGALAQALYDGTWHFFGLTAANTVFGDPTVVVASNGN